MCARERHGLVIWPLEGAEARKEWRVGWGSKMATDVMIQHGALYTSLVSRKVTKLINYQTTGFLRGK